MDFFFIVSTLRKFDPISHYFSRFCICGQDWQKLLVTQIKKEILHSYVLVGWCLWRAGCISQDTYLLYLKLITRGVFADCNHDLLKDCGASSVIVIVDSQAVSEVIRYLESHSTSAGVFGY